MSGANPLSNLKPGEFSLLSLQEVAGMETLIMGIVLGNRLRIILTKKFL